MATPRRPLRRPAGRYSPDRRWTVPRLVAATGGGLIVTAVIVAFAIKIMHPAVQVGVLRFWTAARSVRIEFVVDKAPRSTAVCLVRSRDQAGQPVGSAEVTIPPQPSGARRTVVTYWLTTTGPPNTGEVSNCRIVQAATPASRSPGAP